MKIGNPADKPLPVAPAPSQTAPAADAAQGGQRRHAILRRRAAAVDASAKVELSSTASTLLSGGASARVRCRQGRPHLASDRRRHVQGQPGGDRRQADRQRAGVAGQGPALTSRSAAAPIVPDESVPMPFAGDSGRCRGLAVLETSLATSSPAWRRSARPARARRGGDRSACRRTASGARRARSSQFSTPRAAARCRRAAQPTRQRERPGRRAARVAGARHRGARPRHRRAVAARRRRALLELGCGRPQPARRRDPGLTGPVGLHREQATSSRRRLLEPEILGHPHARLDALVVAGQQLDLPVAEAAVERARRPVRAHAPRGRSGRRRRPRAVVSSQADQAAPMP